MKSLLTRIWLLGLLLLIFGDKLSIWYMFGELRSERRNLSQVVFKKATFGYLMASVSKGAFWAINEQERIDVLKCVTVARGLVQISCVKRIASGPLATHQISVRSVRPFPIYGKGEHLHLHMCGRSAVPHPELL